MRNLILVLVLALAAGGLYLLLGTDDAGNDGGDPSVVDDGGAGEERTGPGLRGTGLGPAVVVEGLATGRGSISGFAKRGGMNVPARVEIRQMMTFGENGMFSVFEGGGREVEAETPRLEIEQAPVEGDVGGVEVPKVVFGAVLEEVIAELLGPRTIDVAHGRRGG